MDQNESQLDFQTESSFIKIIDQNSKDATDTKGFRSTSESFEKIPVGKLGKSEKVDVINSLNDKNIKKSTEDPFNILKSSSIFNAVNEEENKLKNVVRKISNANNKKVRKSLSLLPKQ